MDAPDLAPAARKRFRPDASPATDQATVAPAPSGELTARVAATESAVRAVDARLEALERTTRASSDQLRAEVAAGFQEVASRSLVLAESTDEILSRLDATVNEVRARVAIVDDRVESAGPQWEEIQRRVADLAVAVIALQPTIDAIIELRSSIELVGSRLSTLLGGPTLTELMDRIDELDDGRKR